MPPRAPDATLDAAEQALRARRADEAERLAAAVLKSRRNDPRAARVVGQARLVLDRPQEAIEPLQAAARRLADAETETLLARALSRCGRDAAAQDVLRQAITRRPPFPLAFLDLGDLLGRLGRRDEAVSVLEEGVSLMPDAAVLQISLGYQRLARRERDAARALFAGLAAQRTDAVIGLARVAVQDGDYGAAAELYRRALAARPDDDGLRIELARCLLEAGDRAGGEALLRAATRGGAQLAWLALNELSSAPHGRAFLRPSGAIAFLRGRKG